MIYAIVGTRRRDCKQYVTDFVRSLPAETVVVSGGCRGVDTWAIEAAKARGLETQVFLPKLPPSGAPRHEFTKAYYERNAQVAAACDVLVAFVSADRKGGTENTIKQAKKLNKQVIIL